MASTTFQDRKTPIYASWLNDINSAVFLGKAFDTINVINVKDPTYGAMGDGVTDDTAAIQAAITAVSVIGGQVYLPPGTYVLSAALNISSAKVMVRGSGRKATTLRQNTLSARTFNITNEYVTLTDFSIEYNSAGTTGGVAVFSSHFYGCFSNLYIKNAFIGVQFDSGSNSNQLVNISIENTTSIGFYVKSGGANVSLTNFWILNTNTTQCALGCIRLEDQVEGCVFTSGQTFQGAYSMTTAAASYTTGSRPAYNKFIGVYFDSAANGVIVDKCVEFDFDNCWFSNRPENGAVITTSDGIRFIGGGAINCAKHGILVEASATRVIFTGFSARGNSTASAGIYYGIIFAANTTDFMVTNGMFGGTLSFGTQAGGVRVNAGTSDRYSIKNNLVTGTGGAVSDLGSGVNKAVGENY
jgi:hypothetical protein